MSTDSFNKLVQDARIKGAARMLDDNKPVTPEDAATVLLRLKSFCDETKMTQRDVARAMGISETTLSTVRRGNYGADNEAIVRKIDKFLEDAAIRAAASGKPSEAECFVLTAVAEQMLGMAMSVKKKAWMGYFGAPAGLGKSMALRAIERQTVGAIYMQCRTGVDTNLAVFRQLAAAMKEDPSGTFSSLFDRLLNRLKGTNRLLLIDQAHKLLDRRRDSGLLALGDLHDESKCPMLLCGTSHVLNYLKETKHNRDPIEQLDSRIKIRRDLGEHVAKLLSGGGGPRLFTVESIIELYERQKIRLMPDAADYLTDLANKVSGHLRACDALVEMAGLLFGDKNGVMSRAISVADLREAAKHSIGATAATNREQMFRPRMVAAG